MRNAVVSLSAPIFSRRAFASFFAAGDMSMTAILNLGIVDSACRIPSTIMSSSSSAWRNAVMNSCSSCAVIECPNSPARMRSAPILRRYLARCISRPRILRQARSNSWLLAGATDIHLSARVLNVSREICRRGKSRVKSPVSTWSFLEISAAPCSSSPS